MMRNIILFFFLLPYFFLPPVLADSISRVEIIHGDLSEPQPAEDHLLTVHFIDVGGGDAILIDTPTDKKILIDGGYNYNDRSLAKKEYLAYLDGRVESRLSYLPAAIS